MTEPTQADALMALEFALEWYPSRTSRWQNKVAAEWLRGYLNEPSLYGHTKGGNFAKPLRDAWREGQQAYRRKLVVQGKPA